LRMFLVGVYCVTVQESTFLAQASQARLGENDKDSNYVVV